MQDASTSLDDEGPELPDTNAAREEAIRACGEMLRDVPWTINNGDPFCLWATDQSHGEGHTLFALRVAAQSE